MTVFRFCFLLKKIYCPSVRYVLERYKVENKVSTFPSHGYGRAGVKGQFPQLLEEMQIFSLCDPQILISTKVCPNFVFYFVSLRQKTLRTAGVDGDYYDGECELYLS